jgi:hypothetical protein
MSSTPLDPSPLPRRDFIKFMGVATAVASVDALSAPATADAKAFEKQYQRDEFERSVAYLRRLGAGVQKV